MLCPQTSALFTAVNARLPQRFNISLISPSPLLASPYAPEHTRTRLSLITTLLTPTLARILVFRSQIHNFRLSLNIIVFVYRTPALNPVLFTLLCHFLWFLFISHEKGYNGVMTFRAQCVCCFPVSCLLAGSERTFMLVHANFLFLPAFGSDLPVLLLTPCQYTRNSSHWTPLDANNNIAH